MLPRKVSKNRVPSPPPPASYAYGKVCSNQIVYLLKRCVGLNAAKQVKVCIRLKGV